MSRTEGILCGLTDAKPTFEDECPDYNEDEAQVARLERFEKQHNPEEVNKESIYRYLTAGIPLFLVGFCFMFLPLLNMGIGFLQVVGGIATLIGLLLIILSVVKTTSNVVNHDNSKNKKGVPEESKPQSDDLEIY
mgnify:FL=1|jgi:Ca2+/Na+ antiporter